MATRTRNPKPAPEAAAPEAAAPAPELVSVREVATRFEAMAKRESITFDKLVELRTDVDLLTARVATLTLEIAKLRIIEAKPEAKPGTRTRTKPEAKPEAAAPEPAPEAKPAKPAKPAKTVAVPEPFTFECDNVSVTLRALQNAKPEAMAKGARAFGTGPTAAVAVANLREAFAAAGNTPGSQLQNAAGWKRVARYAKRWEGEIIATLA